MILIRRLALLVLLCLIGWSATTRPVRAQTSLASKYMFADTTLLRDTLDLHFNRLFELADSLRTSPDSLRAYSIRYLLPLDRLAHLADSLRVPVDSIGAVLERERYNPLTVTVARQTDFAYSSVYGVNRQTQSWSNSVNYDLVRGPIVFKNTTSVRIDRVNTEDYIQRAKSSNTETGWKFSPNFATGARINLRRNESFRPGSIYNKTITINEYQFSMRSRQQPGPNTNTEFNLFTGPFSEPNSIPIKSGFSTVADGRLEYGRGIVAFDMNGNGTARLGQGHLKDRVSFPTHDLQGGLNGTLSVQPHLPLAVRIGYDLRDELVERPDTVTAFSEGVPTVVDTLNREPSNTAGVDLSVQYQLRQWASLTATSRISTTTDQIAVSRNNRFVYDRSITQDKGYGLDAQANARGWVLDAHFSEGRPESETPRQTALQLTNTSATDSVVTVNYRERSLSTARAISANLSKNLGTRLLLRGTGSVTLNQYRYVVTDSSYATETGDARVDPSDPRDDYRQLYRMEATYSGPNGLSSTVGLEVSRTLTVFLKSNRSDANREDKVYRADWRWTYRLTRLLTVTQRNQINSAYTDIVFRPERNRLGMTYLSITTLTSQVTPRLGLDITHNASYRPNGDYLLSTDGENSFTISDASHDYTLSSRIAYTPINAVTISLEPYYQSTDRQTVNAGIRTPDNRRTSLNLSGGASLNLRVGDRGALTGNLARQIQSSRYERSSNGVLVQEPRAEIDYWTGSLQFSWRL
jgi:hypothetical protein